MKEIGTVRRLSGILGLPTEGEFVDIGGKGIWLAKSNHSTNKQGHWVGKREIGSEVPQGANEKGGSVQGKH